MSKNELQKLIDSTPVKSYREKIDAVEKYFINVADGENIIGNGKEIIYPEKLWKYKHSFADGVYNREMQMKKGQLGISPIHKHSYGFFLLSGVLAGTKEGGIDEFIAPCYIVSPQGAKRIVYAVEDCKIVTVHANPTNTEDIKELEDNMITYSWKEYEEFLKDNKNETK